MKDVFLTKRYRSPALDSLRAVPYVSGGGGTGDLSGYYTKAQADALLILKAGLADTQTFTGINTFYSGQKINNPDNTFAYTLTSAAITANRILNLPLITDTDTLAVLALAQTFSGIKTFSANPVLSADSAILSFSSATGVKQITTGGTTDLALMPGGNVGIGKTPASGIKLDVDGIISSSNLYTTGSGVPIRVTNDTYNEWIIQKRRSDDSHKAGLREFGSNGGLAIVTRDINRINIDSDGNVVIGGTTAAAKLDVRGKLAINPTVAAGSALHVQAESGDTNLARFWNSDYAEGVGSGIRMYTGAATGNTYTAIQAYGAGATATNDFLLQPVGGKVGIGKTPETGVKLDVDGTIKGTYGIIEKSTGTEILKLVDTGASSDTGANPWMAFYNGETRLGYVGFGSSINTDLYLTNDKGNINFYPIGGTKAIVQGVLNTDNGTALLPAYSFTSDENTGIYRISEDTLGFSTAGTERMRIGSTGNVGINTTTPSEKLDVAGGVTYITSTFVTGFAGEGSKLVKSGTQWDMELDNLTVRGTMNVYELLIKKIRATGGAVWVSEAHKVTAVDEYEDREWNFEIDDDDENITVEFAVDDILRCQTWTGRGIKQYHIQVTQIHTPATGFSGSKIAGAGVPEAGDDLVRIGNVDDTDRQGALYLTSSDSEAPYMDIVDGVTDESLAGHTKVRLGKLTGITDAEFGGALSGYGLYSDNVYLKGRIVANAGLIGGFTIDSTEGLYSGTGTTRVHMKADAGFWCGHDTQASAPFSVTQAGVLKATSGTIGGFKITTNTLYTRLYENYDYGGLQLNAGASPSIMCHADDGVYVRMHYTNAGSWGLEGKDSNAATVFQLGSTNNIAGWSFDSDSLYVGSAATRIQFQSSVGIHMGATAFASAPFSVTRAGLLKATSGTIGGWTLASDAIYTGTKKTSDGHSTSGITLASNGTIHTPYFRADSDGSIGIIFKDGYFTTGYANFDDDGMILGSSDYVDPLALLSPYQGLKFYKADSTTLLLKMGLHWYTGRPIINWYDDAVTDTWMILTDNYLGYSSSVEDISTSTKIISWNSNGLYTLRGRVKKIERISTTTSLTGAHHIVICNNTSAIDVDLPASPVTGQEYVIKRINSGAVVVDAGAKNIIGPSSTGSTITIASTNSWWLVYDGTAWNVLANAA